MAWVGLGADGLSSSAYGPEAAFRELEIVTPGAAPHLHIPTRPSMSFHGNMQVAIAEARTLGRQASKVSLGNASASAAKAGSPSGFGT